MYILLFLILLVPNILFVFINSLFTFDGLFFLFTSASLLFVPLFFFKSIKKYFKTMSIFLLFLPLELFYISSYGSSFSVNIISISLNSSFKEVVELLPSFLFHIASSFVLVLMFFYILNKVEDTVITPLIKKAILLFIIFSFSFKFFISLLNNGILYENNSLKSDVIYVKTLMNEIDSVNNYYPLNELYKVILFLNTMNSVEFDSTEKFSSSAESDLIVLVLGETARYSNFGINGYKRNTTPFLEKENILSFKEMYSYDNYTLASLHTLLTRENESIVNIFNKAGYNTVWLSNQGQFGLKTSGISNIAKDSKEKTFLEQSFKNNISSYDEKLLPLIDGYTNSKKTLLIVHTIGSHFNYSFRHPPEFEKFKPSLSGNKNVLLTDIDTKIEKINSYDNSILYTDYILSSIINKLKTRKNPALFLYLSDHGENLFDDSRNMFGHATLNPSKEELHIPFIIWANNEYKRNNKDYMNKLSSNKGNKYTTEVFFDSLLNLAGIKGEKVRNHSLLVEPKNEELFIRDILNKKIKLSDVK